MAGKEAVVFAAFQQVDRNIRLARPEGNLVFASKGDGQRRAPGPGAKQCDPHKPQTWVERT